MEKSSVIKRTVFKNEWAGQNGKVYYHEIELENGDKGQIGTKEQMPAKLNPGQQLTYTIETNDKGTKIKAVNPMQNGAAGGFKKTSGSVGSFCLSYSKDILVAQISNPMTNAKPMTKQEMFGLAEEMYAWLQTHV